MEGEKNDRVVGSIDRKYNAGAAECLYESVTRARVRSVDYAPGCKHNAIRERLKLTLAFTVQRDDN